MAPGELVQQFISRLSEARLCMEQGLEQGTADILKGILAEIEEKDFPEPAREEIRSRTVSMLNSLNEPGQYGERSRRRISTQPIPSSSTTMDRHLWTGSSGRKPFNN